MLQFSLLILKKHILARNRVILRILCENRFGDFGCGALEKLGKKSRVNIFDVQFRAYGEKKPLQGPWLNFACWQISRT